ncbi:MAG: hypothetical protein RI947_315 [Candidatus Parcubacteria bacterium]|jgi:hypothetical protein
MKSDRLTLIVRDLTPQRILFLIILLGFWIRVFFVLSADFPLNDGGMFYTMVNDILSNGFRLPHYASYNHSGIPYAYPFLGFYLTAFISYALHIPVISLIRFLPLLFSVLTIPLVYGIAKILLRSSLFGLGAAIVFAILPRSYEWMIMGGGLTRSLGFVWALASIVTCLVYARHSAQKYVIYTGICLGLTFMSHLEMSLFALYSVLLLTTYTTGLKRTLKIYCIAVFVGITVSSIWWIPVINTHGIQVFMRAFMTGFWSYSAILPLVFFNFTQEPFINLFAVLALLGVWVSLFRKEYLLPVWLSMIFVVNHRSASTMATLVVGLLSMNALRFLILPTLQSLDRSNRRRAMQYAIGIVTIYILSLFIGLILPKTSSLQSLNSTDISAMRWVRAHTKLSSSFLIVSALPYNAWAQDKVSEWFPAITERKSVMTIQGMEWLPDNLFNKRYELTRHMKECNNDSIDCLERTMKKNNLSFNYLYITDTKLSETYSCCSLLLSSLKSSKRYSKIYSKEDISIWIKK